MNAADYRLMSYFELIDRINGTVSWDDEENEFCMRVLCDHYHIDFDAYDDYEILWDQIIRKVYDDAVVAHEYSIDNMDYVIISLESDPESEYAVIDSLDKNIMFDVYEIGSMRECKKFVKERVDFE